MNRYHKMDKTEIIVILLLVFVVTIFVIWSWYMILKAWEYFKSWI